MKVNYKLNDKVSFLCEGDEMVEVFEELANLEEVFGIDKCGKCGKSEVKHVVRDVKDVGKFYEIHCMSNGCYARASFGVNKKGGGLFPHRDDKYKIEWLTWEQIKAKSEKKE